FPAGEPAAPAEDRCPICFGLAVSRTFVLTAALCVILAIIFETARLVAAPQLILLARRHFSPAQHRAPPPVPIPASSSSVIPARREQATRHGDSGKRSMIRSSDTSLFGSGIAARSRWRRACGGGLVVAGLFAVAADAQELPDLQRELREIRQHYDAELKRLRRDYEARIDRLEKQVKAAEAAAHKAPSTVATAAARKTPSAVV